MNIQSTIEFLKLLGFKLVIDNNKMIFYDNETNDMIESFYNNVPLPYYADDVWDTDVTLDKILKGGRVQLVTKEKVLAFGLTYPIINRKRIDSIFISKMDYSKLNDGKIVNKCYVRFDESRNSFVEIISYNNDGVEYKTAMFSNGDIRFIKDRRTGYVLDSFDDGFELSRDEMVEVLDNTFILDEITNYYSLLLPNIKDSIKRVKQAKNNISHC